jgi:hypothetical protein
MFFFEKRTFRQTTAGGLDDAFSACECSAGAQVAARMTTPPTRTLCFTVPPLLEAAQVAARMTRPLSPFRGPKGPELSHSKPYAPSRQHHLAIEYLGKLILLSAAACQRQLPRPGVIYLLSQLKIIAQWHGSALLLLYISMLIAADRVLRCCYNISRMIAADTLTRTPES